MAEDGTDGWRARLFLLLVALMLFGGLTFLGIKLFHEAGVYPPTR